jgi:hypothetical protein
VLNAVSVSVPVPTFIKPKCLQCFYDAARLVALLLPTLNVSAAGDCQLFRAAKTINCFMNIQIERPAQAHIPFTRPIRNLFAA